MHDSHKEIRNDSRPTHSQEYNQTQPSQHSWVYQAINKQANILMGLSDYSQSIQHSHQVAAKTTNRWVYHDAKDLEILNY